MDVYSPTYIQKLFDNMASSYEKVNYCTSFGFSLRWRKQFLSHLTSRSTPVKVADIMTGMGETWYYVKTKWQEAEIYGIDFSEGMLKHAYSRNKKQFKNQVKIYHHDVLLNNFPEGYFDVITCAFGLKTLNESQVKELARETHRLLKPGGQFSFVEISVPENYFLRLLYMFYMKRIIPFFGNVLLNSPAKYKMLGYFTQKYQNSQSALELFRMAGLTVTYQSFFFGCATGFYGEK